MLFHKIPMLFTLIWNHEKSVSSEVGFDLKFCWISFLIFPLNFLLGDNAWKGIYTREKVLNPFMWKTCKFHLSYKKHIHLSTNQCHVTEQIPHNSISLSRFLINYCHPKTERKKGQRWGIFINSPEMAQKIHLVNMSIKNRKIGTQKGTKFP